MANMTWTPWTPYHTKLCDELARLIWDKASAQRIAVEAGVNPAHVTFSDNPANNWNEIIRMADANDVLIPLIERAIKQYPRNETLEEVLGIFKEREKKSGDKPPPPKPIGVGAKVVVALSGLLIAFWSVWGTTLWGQARTGEMSMFLYLFLTLSHGLLPLVGGVLVVVKSRAAMYVFGVAALCGVLVLFIRPDLLLLPLITIALAGCACVLSAWRFRPRS